MEGEEEIVENINSKVHVVDGEDLENEIPCSYLAGELAWARVGTAPFWPCTITYDPDLKIHSYVSKVQQSGHRQVKKFTIIDMIEFSLLKSCQIFVIQYR